MRMRRNTVYFFKRQTAQGEDCYFLNVIAIPQIGAALTNKRTRKECAKQFETYIHYTQGYR